MDQELKPQNIVILSLPKFLDGAKDYPLDVAITEWQGASMQRKEYLMDFYTNSVHLYQHLLGIVYDHRPLSAFKFQKNAFAALDMANENGNRYTLTEDKSGLIIARLDTEGLKLPIENSDDLFRRIAKEESEISLKQAAICQLLQQYDTSC